jgi:hypothetical protein
MFGDAKAVENNFSRWALTVTGVSIVLVCPHNERPTRDIDEIAVVCAARAEFSLFYRILRFRSRLFDPLGGTAWHRC